jgi:hypothetical protein
MLFKRVSKGRNCPQCKSADVFRLRRTGMALKLIGNVTNLRPYWCANCDTFFLAPRQGNRAQASKGFDLPKGQTGGRSPSGPERLAH